MSPGISVEPPNRLSGRTTANVPKAHVFRHQESTTTFPHVPSKISTSQESDRSPSHKRKSADARSETSHFFSDDLTIPDLSDSRDPNNPYQSLQPLKKMHKQSLPALDHSRIPSSRRMSTDSFRRVLFANELVQPNFSSLSKIDPSLFCESISNLLTPIVHENIGDDYQQSLGLSQANVNAILSKNNHHSLDGVPRQSAVRPGFSNLSGPSRAHVLSATHSTFDLADSDESSQPKYENQVSHVPGVIEATASDPVHISVDSALVNNRCSSSNHVINDSQSQTDLTFASLCHHPSRSSDVMTDHREYIDSILITSKFCFLTLSSTKLLFKSCRDEQHSLFTVFFMWPPSLYRSVFGIILRI